MALKALVLSALASPLRCWDWRDLLAGSGGEEAWLLGAESGYDPETGGTLPLLGGMVQLSEATLRELNEIFTRHSLPTQDVSWLTQIVTMLRAELAREAKAAGEAYHGRFPRAGAAAAFA